MNKLFSGLLIPGLVWLTLPALAQPQYFPNQSQQVSQEAVFSAEELDQILGSIALYPDPLLAQVLPAAAYTGEIAEASAYLQAYPDGRGVDDQPWDDSVRAIAHYPEVIELLSRDLAWTSAVGQAFAYQMTDVAASVQRLRQQAYNYGHLQNTPQQTISYGGPNLVSILPTNPEILYVPSYDPRLVYAPTPYLGQPRSVVSFGIGFRVGSWLTIGFDWIGRSCFRYPQNQYWGPGGGVWDNYYSRGRNNVYVTNVYNVRNVHERYNYNNRAIWRVNRPLYQRAQIASSERPYYQHRRGGSHSNNVQRQQPQARPQLQRRTYSRPPQRPQQQRPQARPQQQRPTYSRPPQRPHQQQPQARPQQRPQRQQPQARPQQQRPTYSRPQQRPQRQNNAEPNRQRRGGERKSRD